MWVDDYALPTPAVNHRASAFVDYPGRTLAGFGSEGRWDRGAREENVHKRMIEFLKKRWESAKMVDPMEAERERNHKHMINERMRRVKQKQSLQELHKLLPQGTKVSTFLILLCNFPPFFFQFVMTAFGAEDLGWVFAYRVIRIP